MAGGILHYPCLVQTAGGIITVRRAPIVLIKLRKKQRERCRGAEGPRKLIAIRSGLAGTAVVNDAPVLVNEALT